MIFLTNKTEDSNKKHNKDEKKSIFIDALSTDSRKRVLLSSYQTVGNVIVDALIIAVLLALLVGTVQIFLRLPSILKEDFFSKVSHSVLNDVMVVFIFVELFRVLIDYFKEERVKITYIADATLVFIFKEIWVKFSEPTFDPLKMLAMSGAIIAVALVRVIAVLYSPYRHGRELTSRPKGKQAYEEPVSASD